MKISLNEIKKLVKIPSGVSDEELIKLIGARLVEVEGSEDWGEKYKGIKIVRVETCEAIPETHLHLCQIDCGEKVQVVCGAPNVHAGMFAVWIAPGCIVPETFGTDEPFEIGSRKLRGYDSSGMLAAADELALGEGHDGILELDPEMPGVKPGASFAEVFDLNDIILDIENKSLTHRPDCFGLIGFAREVAGILGVEFEEPDFMHHETVFKEGFLEEITDGLRSKNSDIKITTDLSLCPRYSCAVVEFSDAPHSEYFTLDDVFLIKADMHPISPIVDVTNILMLRTGQPLHAFDYDKFIKVGGKETPEIIVRAAKNGEKLELLDGETIECDENDILITSSDVPVALAGAMGGASTMIDEATSRVLLESATFSLYHLRKTQMKHGIFSEAITRFTKGQPAGQTWNVMAEAVKELGAEPVEAADYYPEPVTTSPIKVTVKEINSLLGTDYDEKLIKKTLENVGITSEGDKYNVPFWRTDLHIKEDIIEEVGRLLGFDNIPLDFPTRPFIGAKEDPMRILKNRIRDILSDRLNAHEVLTYSFVSKALQEKFGEEPKDSYEIINSISPELQCFRQSLAPSLLEKVQENQKAGYKDFALYEINQVAKKSDGLNNEGVPVMKTNLALVVTGDFYQAKAYVEELKKELNTDIDIKISELKNSLLKRFKLDEPVAYFETTLDDFLDKTYEVKPKTLRFSRFPSVNRDLTIMVSENTPYQNVYDALNKALEETGLIYKITPVSIYEPKENLEKTKNLSFHLLLNSEDKTLNGSEISAIMNEVINKTEQAVGGKII
ncbi:phenylalanine--tRNA ligase subunit beta [Candidatus Saccharibacteria bacterium]|nr:phenylalanine--tRNA ligase subunit beta [Candidatus Saccharibacteria bacterium]